MATALSLALRITGDGSGLKLTPVERALKQLETQTQSITAAFDKFKDSSAAAGAAQQRFASDFQVLENTLKAGLLTPQEFADEYTKLTQAARETAAAFEEGARIAAQNRTEEERRIPILEELSRLRRLGALDEESYSRAVAEASGANEAAAKAEQELARQRQRAEEIIRGNLTSLERAQRDYIAALTEVDRLENRKLLTERQAIAERERLTRVLEKAAAAQEKSAGATQTQTLKFNELSGIFAILPGRIGSVAGRLSGLASAGEGLSRAFAGNVSASLRGIGTAVAGLINPFTAAAGAIAGFGLAFRNITQGLIALDDRVEKLGNTADKLGVSFEFVQTLDEAARRSGTSIDAVSAAFGRLQKSVLGVDEESKAAQKALADIGVTAQQIQELDPQRQYELISQAISRIENPARRTAAAIALFGKAGSDLLPVFRNIGGAADDLAQVGAALSDSQRRDVDDFGAALDRLAVSARGAGEQVNASFAPIGETIANSLANATGAIAQFLQRQNDFTRQTREIEKLRELIDFRRITEEDTAIIRAGGTAEQTIERLRAGAEEVNRIVESTAEFVQLGGKSQELLSRAIERVADLGQEGFAVTVRYQEALREVDSLISEGVIESEAQATQARRNATAEYERQIEVVKRVADEQRKASEEARRLAEREIEATQEVIDKTLERIAIERDFAGDAARARNAADLERVRAEIARTEAEIAKAAEAGDADAAKRTSARLAQLDQVQSALAEAEQRYADLADEAAQGFTDGFSNAFAETTRGLDGLIRKASEFGNEGALAAQQLQQGIAQAQARVRAGIFNRPAYEAEVAAQRALFDQRVDEIEAERKAREQKIADEFNLQVDANRRLNEFMRSLMSDRERAEADAIQESFERRRLAVQNIQQIEQQIALQQESIEAAREQNDLRSARARTNELKALEQLKAVEQQIADGKIDAARQASELAQQTAEVDRAQQKAFEDAVKAQEQAQQQYLQQQQKLFEERRKAEEAEFVRQSERLRELNTLGSRTVNTADVRTQEGAALVLDLAANAQDPRLIEARIQTKLQRQFVANTLALVNRLAGPSTIL